MGVNRYAIAKALGISPTTVTRALNDSSAISELTKEKVRAKAKELGYVPSRIGKSHFQKKSFQIGVLLPLLDTKLSHSMIEYYTHCVSGLSIKALEFDYSVCIIVDQGMTYDALREMVQSKKVDALVFLDGQNDDSRQKQLIYDKVPVVSIGYYPQDPLIPTVVSDYSSGLYELFELLGADKPSKILFLREACFNRNVDKLEDDMMIVADAFELEVEKCTTSRHDSTWLQVIHQFIIQAPDSLIVCANDLDGIEVINSLTLTNYVVGKDVRIIGCNNIFSSKVIKPSLTTISGSINLMGRTAIEVLMAYMNDGLVSYVELPTRLYKGDSC